MLPNHHHLFRLMSVLLCGAALLCIAPSFQGRILQGPRAKKSLDAIKEMIQREQWAEAETRLRSYLNSPHGRRYEVDYWLGVCLCRMNKRGDGQNHLKSALGYNINDKEKEKVKQEMGWCGAEGAQPQGRRLIPAPAQPEAAAGTSSTGKKSFRFRNQFLGPEVTKASAPLRQLRELSPQELEARLFETSRRVDRDVVLQLYGLQEGGHINVGEHFIIISWNRFSGKLLDGLERSLKFFVSEYRVHEPRYFITAHLLGLNDEVISLARETHGVELDVDTIGYSFFEDLSIAGVSDGERYGTLKHELFHLLARSNFGDIPPWLDEGMASLYEDSVFEGQRLVGRRNWRGDVLRENWRTRPRLDQLVRMNWQEFNERAGRENRILTNHATARYFMLYLQETGRLKAVYSALQNMRDTHSGKFLSQDPTAVIESVLGKSLLEVDKDFSRWFRRRR